MTGLKGRAMAAAIAFRRLGSTLLVVALSLLATVVVAEPASAATLTTSRTCTSGSKSATAYLSYNNVTGYSTSVRYRMSPGGSVDSTNDLTTFQYAVSGAPTYTDPFEFGYPTVWAVWRDLLRDNNTRNSLSGGNTWPVGYHRSNLTAYGYSFEFSWTGGGFCTVGLAPNINVP